MTYEKFKPFYLVRKKLQQFTILTWQKHYLFNLTSIGNILHFTKTFQEIINGDADVWAFLKGSLNESNKSFAWSLVKTRWSSWLKNILAKQFVVIS